MSEVPNRRKLSRADAQRTPYLLWNAMIDLVATTPLDRLTPIQRVAALAFWYEAEVQNGGHRDYFDSPHGRFAPETLDALSEMGALQQRQVLEKALAGRGASMGFEALDAAYEDCEPTMNELLQRWLVTHLEEFIELAEQEGA